MPRRALIVVDVQNDFIGPAASLGVPDGDKVIPEINQLLDPSKGWFDLTVSTQDWHPQNHVSFAVNHPGKKPFLDEIDIASPADSSVKMKSIVWPVHAVQDTHGAQLVPSLRSDWIQASVKKGTQSYVDMYSGFGDPFGVVKTDLTDILLQHGIDEIFLVGLALDFCVAYTAMDAVKYIPNSKVYIIDEATRPIDPTPLHVQDTWRQVEAAGVRRIHYHEAEALLDRKEY